MALTTYGAQNLVIEQDYCKKFNTIEVGEPAVTVELSGNRPVVQINTWYKTLQEETARLRYVGMDYDTAQACADAMRQSLTIQKSVWGYGTYLSGSTLLYGYYAERMEPQLQSDVTVVKNGLGAMYDVVVDARVEQEEYSKNGLPSIRSSMPLRSFLYSLNGWSTYPSGWSDGKAMSAATADNLVLAAAPTRLREFEIAGQDIMPVGNSLSNITFPIWYKCTDTYTCQVKYTGMTLQACRNLYNQLTSVTGIDNTGWYLLTHPYVYTYDPELSTFNWVEDSSVAQYQCLNEFRATNGGSNMWTAELFLKAVDYQYMKNPGYVSSWAWPSMWSRIPGLQKYL